MQMRGDFARGAARAFGLAALLGGLWLGGSQPAKAAAGTTGADCETPLPKPTEVGAEAFTKALGAFIGAKDADPSTRCYIALDWPSDFGLREAGPFLVTDPRRGDTFNGGVHGNGKVRNYYSPDLFAWMQEHRAHGDHGGPEARVPDGAVVIKEMWSREAGDLTALSFSGWAIMVMDYAGSWDGWFYTDGSWQGEPSPADATSKWSFYNYNAFGAYCVNCHASAVGNETFSNLGNTVDPATLPSTTGAPLGFMTNLPSMPLRVDEGALEESAVHGRGDAPGPTVDTARDPAFNPDAFDWYPNVKSGFRAEKPAPMPFESYDQTPQLSRGAVAQRDGKRRPFLTSGQCIGCHDATINSDALPNMTLVRDGPDGPDGEEERINLSPYSEWRYSLMGLSGRDPVFYAQLEYERSLHPEIAETIDNTCLSCHGVMGARTQAVDGSGEPFTHEQAMALDDLGALARDGVSCTVCHQIEPDGLGTGESYVGHFKTNPMGDTVYGPYRDVIERPMENAIGMTPVHGEQLSSSALCGSCHTVFTPKLDVDKQYTAEEFADLADDYKDEGAKGFVFHEQTTYFEWRNSVYSTEVADPGPSAQDCRTCHMPTEYDGKDLAFRIASIEDNTFPFVEWRQPDPALELAVRGDEPGERYSRHALHGINMFTLSFFDQYPWLLGVGKGDPMAGTRGMEVALDGMARMARHDSARVTVSDLAVEGNRVSAEVRVENLAGHKLPSGVGFRRAFLTVEVLVDGEPVWASGLSDANGVIGTLQDQGRFRPLASEFHEGGAWQPHHETVTDQDQVQIYQELVRNSAGAFTTSFLSLSDEVKDNRLQPRGWHPDGPNADQTKPHGKAAGDPDYADGGGADRVRYVATLAEPPAGAVSVRARLYYQALPPTWLNERFEILDRPATQRLAYMVQNLDDSGPIQGMKLLLDEATAAR